LGERAGNAALEEVVMALHTICRISSGIDTRRLLEVSRLVEVATGITLPRWKAIVGENNFAHESGIHAAGVLQDPTTYEPFSPEELGRERRLVVGKHSGRKGLRDFFQKKGIVLAQEEATSLLETVRSLSVKMKRSLTEEELLGLVSPSTRRSVDLEA